MKISEIKSSALNSLKGNWGSVISLHLVYIIIVYLITFGLSLFLVDYLSPIILLVLEIPLQFGLIACLINIKKGNPHKIKDLFSFSFKNFGRAWKIIGHEFLKLLAPFLCYFASLLILIIVVLLLFFKNDGNVAVSISANILNLFIFILYLTSFIWLVSRSLLLVLSNYIAIDNPELSAKESVQKSMEFMKGNRLKYLLFSFSFIGWLFLSTLTLGLGLIWLIPYISFATIVFYESVSKNSDNQIQEQE